jgi:hypothetical protein
MSVYGGDALAIATLKKWNKCFREGRIDIFDDPRVGHPSHMISLK